MKIIDKKYRGKTIQVVKDSPCEPCSNWGQCKKNYTYCSAFTQYVNSGWYDIVKVGKRLKRL